MNFLKKLFGVESDVVRLSRLQFNHEQNLKTYKALKEHAYMLQVLFDATPDGEPSSDIEHNLKVIKVRAFKEYLKGDLDRVLEKLDAQSKVVSKNEMLINSLKITLQAQGELV